MANFVKRAHLPNMDWAFNIFAAFLVVRWQLAAAVSGYSLTNATESVLGCAYNNTRFANGSYVPTAEQPCLNCKCLNANVICALRVCPELVFPPPRGCIIVQKKTTCCPYMSCSKLSTVYKDQEKAVVTHDRKWYEQNIRNRIFSQNALQRRIEDSDEEQQLSNGKMCVHNGTVYRSGSAMTTSSLCSYCYCIEGMQKCIQPKCTLPAKDCEPILIDSSCCPIRYDCTGNKTIKARYNTKYNKRRNGNKHYLRMTSRMQRSRGCLIDSTFYPEGHKLPSDQTNPCEICFCIGGSKRCAPKKCAPIIRNCRPIIPDGQCCPSSYDCKTTSDHKSARGFSARQYSDIFSLFFGEEDKENSTTSWDYESETEPVNTELNATSEKDFFDAIKDSLSYAEAEKKPTENETHIPNQIAQPLPNIPSYNVSDDDEEDEDDDDESSISLLDFFLKGESAFTSTTAKPFVFNITGKPLLNGMTNSPMQIQPILPDEMKNESMKFSMLPMSLYNMVKEDGSVLFEDNKSNQTPQPSASHLPKLPSTPSHSPKLPESRNPVKNIESTVSSTTMAKEKISTTTSTAAKSTTSVPKTTTSPAVQTTTEAKPQNSLVKHVSNAASKLNKTEIPSSTTVASKKPTTIRNIIETSTTIMEITKPPQKLDTPKPISRTPPTKVHEKTVLQTSTASPKTKKTTIQTTTVKTTPTASVQQLTTKPTALPKIPAVQINSNPSILETDISYDYSEPTLPPSLPNLKIIPFLPTDAVKNVIHKSDGYKPNYQQRPPAYTNPSYDTPFNVKPNADKYPSYNIADDRIDYDSYKVPAENPESLDYINIFAGGSNMVQPVSFQMNVNSKLDYSHPENAAPSKIPPTVNKNLTVKPPLPPFEPEHLYNLPPQPPIQVGNKYDEYSSISNEPYSPGYNYNVPQFVTIPPINRPAPVKDTVFSYGSKNQFMPPEKTEGGFIPKRANGENYIPLHASNQNADNVDNQAISPNPNKFPINEIIQQEEQLKAYLALNQTIPNFDKHIVSITTDKTNDEYDDGFLEAALLDSFEKQSEDHQAEIHNSANSESAENTITLNKIYASLFGSDDSATLNLSTSPQPKSTTMSSTTPVLTTPKPQLKNLTSNAIPLKLITILNNSKKESLTKVPQRKNNKIIDPTDEPLVEDVNMTSSTTEMSSPSKAHETEDLTILRDVFLSSLNRPSISNGDISDELLHKSPLFLSRPINKLSPSFISSASFPGLNSLESKHNFQSNPIRSELDLIIPELNKNKQTNDFSHTNNYNPENYQVLPADDKNIANTESYVVNPVDVDKLHQSNSETKIFTPPHRDPAGLLKLAGCNIYGRMYRVGAVLSELSSACLECRCTEVGVSCTPLNC